MEPSAVEPRPRECQRWLRPARVLAAPANTVAVAVVEAGTPAPLTFRLAVVVAFDLAMVVPVVAGCFDNRKRNEPKCDACKQAATVTGFSMFDGSCNKTRCQQ